MQDRAPTKPNRYAVYDDAHNFIRYEYHERADEPTQVGDPLNKANLLPDDVAAALGLTGNPQVKDALEKIKTLIDGNTTLANSKAKIETGSYTGTGTYGSESPSSLTFSFVPKLLFISAEKTNRVIGAAGYFALIPYFRLVTGATQFEVKDGSSTTSGKVVNATISNGGKTIAWYYSSDADHQLNKSSYTYHYIAIG